MCDIQIEPQVVKNTKAISKNFKPTALKKAVQVHYKSCTKRAQNFKIQKIQDKGVEEVF